MNKSLTLEWIGIHDYLVVPQDQDGNCFYSSIAYQTTKWTAKDLRMEVSMRVASSMGNDCGDFLESVTLSTLIKTGKWADNLEIFTTMQILEDACIVIVDENRFSLLTIGSIDATHVYLVRLHNEHYDAIILQNIVEEDKIRKLLKNKLSVQAECLQFVYVSFKLIVWVLFIVFFTGFVSVVWKHFVTRFLQNIDTTEFNATFVDAFDTEAVGALSSRFS